MDDAANDEEQRNGNGQKQTGPIQSVVTSKEAPTEAIDDSDHRIQRIDQPPPFWKDGTHKSHWGKVQTKLHDERDDEPEIPILDHQ